MVLSLCMPKALDAVDGRHSGSPHFSELPLMDDKLTARAKSLHRELSLMKEPSAAPRDVATINLQWKDPPAHLAGVQEDVEERPPREGDIVPALLGPTLQQPAAAPRAGSHANGSRQFVKVQSIRQPRGEARQ